MSTILNEWTKRHREKMKWVYERPACPLCKREHRYPVECDYVWQASDFKGEQHGH